MWVPYPLGFCCFGGWPNGFAFPQCFICNSYIHPALHIWPVFHLKSKGCISQCGSVAESAHVAIEEFAGCPLYCSWRAGRAHGCWCGATARQAGWKLKYRPVHRRRKLHNWTQQFHTEKTHVGVMRWLYRGCERKLILTFILLPPPFCGCPCRKREKVSLQPLPVEVISPNSPLILWSLITWL